VVANLPYVPSGAFDELSPEVRVYEPRPALDGGPDGLREIRRLIGQASETLAGNGWLLLEVGAGQSGSVETLMRQAGCWSNVKTVCDLAGVGRVVLGKRISTGSHAYSA
jgi:release factor glutamine methyltransferase